MAIYHGLFHFRLLTFLLSKNTKTCPGHTGRFHAKKKDPAVLCKNRPIIYFFYTRKGGGGVGCTIFIISDSHKFFRDEGEFGLFITLVLKVL